MLFTWNSSAQRLCLAHVNSEVLRGSDRNVFVCLQVTGQSSLYSVNRVCLEEQTLGFIIKSGLKGNLSLSDSSLLPLQFTRSQGKPGPTAL